MSRQGETVARHAGRKPIETQAQGAEREVQPSEFRTPAHGANAGRRWFLLASASAGVGGAAAMTLHDGALGGPAQAFRGAVPWTEGAADAPPQPEAGGYLFFSAAESAFIEAAVARLIPSDPVGPGAIEAGAPFFLDRQLFGRFGQGDHYFLGGPWPKGTPEQGYQSRFTPAQLYRAAIAAIDSHARTQFDGMDFCKLPEATQDAVLKDLEHGEITLTGGVDGKSFFAMFLQNTKEGYFSDPIYGGNKDMSAWKMIGFPGAHYDYKEWVGRHGEPVPFAPVGMLGRPGWTKA
jgi:gluconate 2-dehydrogenase gamma chain